MDVVEGVAEGGIMWALAWRVGMDMRMGVMG